MKIIYTFCAVIFLLSHTLLAVNADSSYRNNKSLRFIDAFEIDLNASQDGFQIGGLSSLYFDETRSQLLAICDDKGILGGPRIHYFDLALSIHQLTVSSSHVVPLKNQQGREIFPDLIVDAEAFDRLANGNWLVSSEGIDVEKYFIEPSLLEFSSDGRLVSMRSVPEKFIPKQLDKPDYGVRPNDVFEGLSLTPDKKQLFLIGEKALLQDGEVSTIANDSVVRIVHYPDIQTEFTRHAEYAYVLSTLPNPENSSQTSGFLSISDLLVLNPRQLLVVEKSYLVKPSRRNTVKLYLTEITDDATDISDINSLRGASYVPVKKTLWADLDDYSELADFPKLDNIEGVIFGPDLPNGNKSLIFVTDNNFSAKQRTLFYAFEVLESLN